MISLGAHRRASRPVFGGWFWRAGATPRSLGAVREECRVASLSAFPSRHAACATLRQPVRRYGPDRCCRAVVSVKLLERSNAWESDTKCEWPMSSTLAMATCIP